MSISRRASGPSRPSPPTSIATCAWRSGRRPHGSWHVVVRLRQRAFYRLQAEDYADARIRAKHVKKNVAPKIMTFRARPATACAGAPCGGLAGREGTHRTTILVSQPGAAKKTRPVHSQEGGSTSECCAIEGTTRGVRSKRPRSNRSVYICPRGTVLRESGSQVGVPKMRSRDRVTTAARASPPTCYTPRAMPQRPTAQRRSLHKPIP